LSDLSAGLLLALVSTFATAFAHALLKKGGDKLAVQAWVRLIGLGFALPVIATVGPPPVTLIGWIIGAAAIHAIYQLVVTWSYSVSDFSVAFPLARGATPLFTTLIGVAWLGDQLGRFAVAGIAAITAGILLLARLGKLSRSGLIAALLAAVLTTAYTVVDAYGVRSAASPMLFIGWFFLADAVAMPAALLMRERTRFFSALAAERRTGIMAGIVTLLAFAPALYAFKLAPVGAVSALRECSILIGLLLGGAMLRERLDASRLGGAALIIVGGLLIIGQSF
jgi:drug/metabolite transporter (DMT)-like permease